MKPPNERRRHRRFITRNTEYHLRENKCVAVRCRNTGAWIEDHIALGTVLSGALARTAHGYAPATPGPGVSLWFDAGHNDVVTSTVQEVDRPERSALGYYAY